MRKLIIVAVFSCALTSLSADAQSCNPFGYFIGGGGGYDLVANGDLSNGDCWTRSGIDVVSTSDCGSTSDKFQIHLAAFGAQTYQQQTVPSDMTYTNWSLIYYMTMQDPNNDGWWNRLRARVYNVTTSQILAEHTYWGDDADVTCSQRTLNFTGDYSGDTLKVIFDGNVAYSDTAIRVENVFLIATD